MLNSRRLCWGIVVASLLMAANRGEALLRARSERARHSRMISESVRLEQNAQGHNSVGIDEAALADAPSERFLYFSTLGRWEYSREAPLPCPPEVKQLDGQRFTSVGFMYPLEAGEKVRSFCLLRSTQTCCYGPRPQYNQYLLIETPEPVSFERFAPVAVSGTLRIDPQPDEGYIYRMEARSVWSAEREVPEVDAAVAAAKVGLPLFDYTPLRAMSRLKGDSPPVPEALRGLDGRKVVLSGYCVDRAPAAAPAMPPVITVGERWWDGVSQGEPPTIFNAVVVHPRDADQVPPVWQPNQVFTGTLRLVSDSGRWRDDGILQLQEAVLGVPGVTPPPGAGRGRARVPWQGEAAVFAACLLPAFTRKRAKVEPQRMKDEQ